MKKPRLYLLLCLVLATLIGYPASAYTVPPKMAWWYEARFGMFIHFGSYSHLGRGEWAFQQENWSKSAYQNQVSAPFNPTKFNAATIVGLAKAAGMKYLVITAKHHEGFSMWRTQVPGFTDVTGTKLYSLYDYTVFKRDILAELKTECDNQGVTFCLYYSILDWNHPSQLIGTSSNGTSFTTMASPTARANYIADMKAQLGELITRYNPAVMWFDGDWCANVPQPTADDWWTAADGQDLYDYLIGLKPDLIVNERVKRDFGIGDFECPEQFVPAAPLSRIWETCQTMNSAWGYDSTKENLYKSTSSMIREMVTTVSRDGNYLLNIGPKGDGSVTQGSTTILNGIANWMGTYKSSIYGTTGSPFGSEPSWGKYTAKPGFLYAHVFNWPSSRVLQVAPIANTITRIYSLKTPGTSLAYTVSSSGISITVPRAAPNSIDSVIVIEVIGTPALPSGPVANGTYPLIAQGSGLSVAVPGGSTANGVQLVQETDNGADSQRWVLTYTGSGGFYKITNRNSGLAMDCSAASTADGAQIIQWTYSGSNNQLWTLVAASGGYYRVVNKNSGKVIGINAAGLLEQQTFTGTGNQLFRLN